MSTPQAVPAAVAAGAFSAAPFAPAASAGAIPAAHASATAAPAVAATAAPAATAADPGEPPEDVPEPIAVGAAAPIAAPPTDLPRITASRAAAASSPAAVAAITGSQRTALFVALGLVLVWGANYSVQKLTFPVIGPDGFLFVRYLIMPVLAIVLLVHRFGIDWPPVERADTWLLARLALAGHVLHVGLVTWGIHLSTAFSSSVMSAVGPLFTLLLLRLAGSSERLGATRLAGLGIALGGILVFLSDKLLAEGWQAGWGDLVLLVAAVFFSYYTVGARDVINRIGGMPVMCYTTLIASPLMVALSWRSGSAVDWSALDARIWAGLLFSIVVSAFFGWLLWGWVNAVRGVARTAPMMYLIPVVAGGCAWFVLGESFSAVKFAGAALTLAGVALAQARFGRRAARAPGSPGEGEPIGHEIGSSAATPARRSWFSLGGGSRRRRRGADGGRDAGALGLGAGLPPLMPARIQPPDEG